jgi:hypothetical protein
MRGEEYSKSHPWQLRLSCNQAKGDQLMPEHEIEIPDWIWEDAKKRWNVEDPTEELRDLLSEAWATLTGTAEASPAEEAAAQTD